MVLREEHYYLHFRRWYYEKNDWIVSDEIEDDEQGKHQTNKNFTVKQLNKKTIVHLNS